ncbi:oxygenase MpaB family protein [Pseudonocardia phyllosphaerae]|uniref:oxygenase MpaB family protein n=1 Tax=Pseudonocardia phyllosphaerae TaxID=3390502 RepID=UPI00397B4872
MADLTAVADYVPDAVTARLAALRSQVGQAVFSRVAGDEGAGRRRRILGAEGPRWFDDDAAIRRVHGDASMFIGGLRALLLQSLHPLAMAGVAGHSGFRGDPWGRLQRTSYFLAATTFGPADEADRVIAAIKRAHSYVHGTAPDGRPYSASDPHLLRWVHIAEIDSFLSAHDRYGGEPLDPAGRDAYVADTARVARELGIPDPPETTAELAAQIAAYRPELRGTPEARDAAKFLLWEPPLPLAARVPYGVLAAASVGLLPRWARTPLRLPWLPVTEATAVRAGGMLITAGIRWVTSAPREPTPPPMPPVHA